MVTTMQEPQRYRGPDGSVYEALPDGTYRRTPPPSQQASPASAGYTLQPMATPSDARAQQDQAWQAEDRDYRRQRDAVVDQRAERQLAITEQSAGLRGNRYQNKFDEARATRDATRFGEAMTGWTEASGLEGGGQRAERILNDGAPVGAFADQRIAAGRIAGDFLGFLPGVPNREQTQQLEQLRLLGSQGALGDVSQLKGPLSEKELAFIQRLQIDPNATRETNLEVAEAMQWAARRQAAYGSAMQRWVNDLGSPSATNRDGLSFDAWWGRYAAENLPRPGTEPTTAEQDEARGSSAATAINYRDPDSREALAAIMADGGWVKNGDGDPYYVGPGGIQVAAPQEGDEATAPGVAMRPRQDGSGQAGMILGPGMAFQRSALEQLPGGDEAVAGLTSLMTDYSYGDIRGAQRAQAGLDRENQPLARNMGGVGGGVALAATPLGAPVRVTRGATLAGRVANRAAGGSIAGGAWGFGQGEGNALERLPGAGQGAAIGAVAGPVAPVVANALARVAAPAVRGVQSANRFVGRQLVNALGDNAPISLREAVQPNALQSGMQRFADRMGPARVNALNPRVASQRDLGMEPTLIDALDDASVGRARALATRDTPARGSAVKFAETRRNNLPSRTARIAREEISADTRPAMDILDAQRTTRRANASSIDTFGNDPVPVSGDLIAALRSDFVKPHLRAAAQRAQGALDPADREASARLAQIADMALDDPNGVSLTVREAQDVSKALNDAAQAAFRAGSPDGPVLRDIANAIRGSAREGSEGYANWLKQYGDDSDLMEAATTGRNFVSVSGDPVNARSTEAFVRNAQGASDAGRDIMRAASREAVEVASSNPSGARTTLDRFASDTDQARRAQALGVDAGRLRDRSQAEIDAVTAAQRASPRIGSESSTNIQDAGDAAGGVIGAIRRPISTAAGAIINRVASRGFSNAEAEAIVTAAQNPAQTEELIGMLAQRMSRREARGLARAIRYQLTTGPQSGQQQ